MTVTEAQPGPPRVGSPVSAGWLTLLFLAFCGLWTPGLAPQIVTMALKVSSIVPAEEASNALGTVLGFGALIVCVGLPFMGQLSDRTTLRWGRRKPWILLGVLGFAITAVGMGLAQDVFSLSVWFGVSMVMFSAANAGLYGVFADQVPRGQRGVAGGLVGASIPVASVASTFLVQLAAPDAVAMFVLPVVVGAVPILVFLCILKDRAIAKEDVARLSWRALIGALWVNPIRYRDFGFVWWGQFFFVLAYAFLLTYQSFFLIESLNEDVADIPGLIFVATLFSSVFTLIASIVGGKVSDMLGRRKVFVAFAALVLCIWMAIVANSDSYVMFVVGASVVGLGSGWWKAVDTALVVDVLPNPENAAKDLGVANIAISLPQSIAPAIAPLILALLAGSYPGLYVVAAGSAVLSAVLVLLARGAK